MWRGRGSCSVSEAKVLVVMGGVTGMAEILRFQPVGDCGYVQFSISVVRMYSRPSVCVVLKKSPHVCPKIYNLLP